SKGTAGLHTPIRQYTKPWKPDLKDPRCLTEGSGELVHVIVPLLKIKSTGFRKETDTKYLLNQKAGTRLRYMSMVFQPLCLRMSNIKPFVKYPALKRLKCSDQDMP